MFMLQSDVSQDEQLNDGCDQEVLDGSKISLNSVMRKVRMFEAKAD